MKILDAHLHFSNIKSFIDTAREKSSVDYSLNGLLEEFNCSNVLFGIGMGVEETSYGEFPDKKSLNPMRLDLDTHEKIFEVLGINPAKLNGKEKEDELKNIEDALNEEKVVGIKIYAGYYHYHVWDTVYDSVYLLAEKYNIPVVIHCGDTYSKNGLLKYSHPLNVDELAVKYKNIDFIIAHFGDPWIMETAEIISKNPNVYADLSGLIVGDKDDVYRFKNEKLFTDHIKRGLVYADNYSKILFGSDWPLVKIEPYIDFVKNLIPSHFHEDVFYNNAVRVFKKIKTYI